MPWSKLGLLWISYEYNGKRMNIKQIYSSCKKTSVDVPDTFYLSMWKVVKVGRIQKDGAALMQRLCGVRIGHNRERLVSANLHGYVPERRRDHPHLWETVGY